MTPFALVDRPNQSEIRPLVQALLSHLPAEEQIDKLATLFPQDFPTHKFANPHIIPVEHKQLDWLDGIFITRNAATQQAEFVLWVHPAPGATAILGQPQRIVLDQHQYELSFQVPQEIACLLLTAAIDWAKQLPIEMLQAVVDRSDCAYHAVLERVGLEKLVDLVFVTSPPVESPAPTKNDSMAADWDFQPVAPDPLNMQRWHQILEATYTNSQDCPSINGKRSAANTIAGYQATGSFLEQGWMIVRSSNEHVPELEANSNGESDQHPTGRDVGCLILADHPGNDFLELIYFGVSPAARGKGLGRHILEKASQFAKKMGRNRIIAAVDRKNLPALRVYAQLEYQAIKETTVFARFFTHRTVRSPASPV